MKKFRNQKGNLPKRAKASKSTGFRAFLPQTPVVNTPVASADEQKSTLFALTRCDNQLSTTGRMTLDYQMSLDNNICWRDHFVYDEHFFPTDGYIELIYSVCYEQLSLAAIELRNITLVYPLICAANESAHIQVIVENQGDGYRFRISATSPGETNSHVLVRGEMAPLDTAKFASNYSQELEPNNRYQALDIDSYYTPGADIRLGDFYRSLKQLKACHAHALGTIDAVTSAQSFLLHPSVVSAALETAMTYGPYLINAKQAFPEDVFLPYGIENLKILKPLTGQKFLSYTECSPTSGDSLELHLELLDEHQQPQMIFSGFRLQRVNREKVIERVKGAKAHPKSTTAETTQTTKPQTRTVDDIAIIGASCRMPKSADIDAFWDMLKKGIDAVTDIPDDRWREFTDWYHPDPAHLSTSHTKRGGYLDDVDKFDPLFFSISPADAELMDPQQRLFLQEAWRAIEHAGYAPDTLKGKPCGVYVGCTTSDYDRVLERYGKDKEAQAFMGNSSAILASRIAYLLNLKGPALAVDTACSSSLAAIHLACESLRNGESEVALAGGVNVFASPLAHVLTSQVGMQSPAGSCNTFDQSADGTVFSEGCGVLLLKPLAAAKRDGDPILALIKGSGINQDGKTNGITAPSAISQQHLIESVYQRFDIDAAQIGYVEAHGTATPLGDPIEVRALSQAFAKHTDQQQYCAIGSVKSNIGHGSYAAGVAGLIKLALCLQHKTLVPTLHYQTANSHIDFEQSPFYVNREQREWVQANGLPRMGTVSSFGFSGTNVHIVLSEYRKPSSSVNVVGPQPPLIVPVSAKAVESLVANVNQLLTVATLANENAQHNIRQLADMAYTLQVGRQAMAEKLIFVAKTPADLLNAMSQYLANPDAPGLQSSTFSVLKPTSEIADQQLMALGVSAHGALIKTWLAGKPVDWHSLYGDDMPQRIHLPGYVFCKDVCWPSGAIVESGAIVKGGALVNTEKPSVAREVSPAAIETVESREPVATTNGMETIASPIPKEAAINTQLLDELKALMGEQLKMPVDKLKSAAPFSDFGLDSIGLTRFARSMSKQYGFEITPAILFGNASLEHLTQYLLDNHQQEFAHLVSETTVTETPMAAQVAQPNSPSMAAEPETAIPVRPQSAAQTRDIAIVGISGAFPQAKNLDAFWENLVDGTCAITEIPADRWSSQSVAVGSHTGPSSATQWGGFLDQIATFDPKFFGISREEANLMDPQQRLLLTHTYWAIEDAGYDPKQLSGTNTGVFVGIGNNDYRRLLEDAGEGGNHFAATGTFPTMGPNRVSYYFNFTGPSEAIDTACSSSLIAMRKAVDALNSGECDAAIVAGVNVIVTPFGHAALGDAGLLSPSGRCRSFSANADGFVRSEGIGVVLLKRCDQAEQSNDHIYGLIKGVAQNHGGRANALTAPNPQAQSALIQAAYQQSGIDPASISYIETHGTGTPLGDPIEIEGLKGAFKAMGLSKQTSPSECGLGSIKTLLGHTELASGMASLFKVLLQFKHQTLIKGTGDDEINPFLNLAKTPLKLIDKNQPWPGEYDRQGKLQPRRAGINAFGSGGVNAHLVLEEYQEKISRMPVADQPQVIIVSANTPAQLRILVQRLAAFVEGAEEINLGNLAYTLQAGRAFMDARLAVVAKDREELVQKFNDFLNGEQSAKPSFFYCDDINSQSDTLYELIEGSTGVQLAQLLISEGAYEKLALYWAQGGDVPWSRLHPQAGLKRLSLPTYPFAEETYWVSPKTLAANGQQADNDESVFDSKLYQQWFN